MKIHEGLTYCSIHIENADSQNRNLENLTFSQPKFRCPAKNCDNALSFKMFFTHTCCSVAFRMFALRKFHSQASDVKISIFTIGASYEDESRLIRKLLKRTFLTANKKNGPCLPVSSYFVKTFFDFIFNGRLLKTGRQGPIFSFAHNKALFKSFRMSLFSILYEAPMMVMDFYVRGLFIAIALI